MCRRAVRCGRRTRPVPGSGGGNPNFEAVKSCPSWLLEMYSQSERGRGSVGASRGLAWAFRVVVGGLVHLDTRDRDGRMRDLAPTVDNIIDWLELVHRGRWANRIRDYSRLTAALDETHYYRVSVAGMRYWLVSAYGIPEVYRAGAPCVLTVRTPAAAAGGRGDAAAPGGRRPSPRAARGRGERTPRRRSQHTRADNCPRPPGPRTVTGKP